MSNRSSKGFTLIELLVVIAIIGILAALVLVALGNARQKANDARIKSNLGQLRTLAEIHYDGNSASYSTPKSFATCVTTPDTTNCAGAIEGDVTSINTDNTSVGGGAFTTNASGQNFCIARPLVSDTTKAICVDATGQFKESVATAAVACPNTGVCS